MTLLKSLAAGETGASASLSLPLLQLEPELQRIICGEWIPPHDFIVSLIPAQFFYLIDLINDRDRWS